MSGISQQSYVNPARSLFVTAAADQQNIVFPPNTGIQFETTATDEISVFGNLSTLNVIGQSAIAVTTDNISLLNTKSPGVYAGSYGIFNSQNTTGGFVPSTLQIASFFPSNTGSGTEMVRLNGSNNSITIPNSQANISNAFISSINGLEQNPSATRFGFYTQTQAGTGVSVVTNNQVRASSLIFVQMIGTYSNTSTYTFSVNPVAGVGFASIADHPLDVAQSMQYYVAKW